MLGSEFLRRGGFYLLVFEALLGAAHLLWPEYRWGQGRQSYFNFDNSLTLASWLISMQLLGVAILALIGFYRDRWAQATARPDRSPDHSSQTAWVWIAGAVVALALSFAEMTRIHTRFELLGLPDPNVYEQLVISLLTLGLLVLFGWFLLHKLQSVPDYYKFGVGWLVAWSAHLVLESFASAIPSGWQTEFSLVTGLTYLFGSTLLLIAVGGYVLRSNAVSQPSSNAVSQTTTTKRWRWPVGFPTVRIQTWTGRTQTWILLGVGGTAFTLIFLQIILFQLVTISDDYLTANSVISIALLGMAVGGLIGYLTARQVPYEAMVSASLLLPFAILLAFATTVTLTDSPLVASVLLMAPFICASTVLTIALVKIDSHVAYFADLVGAGLGALLVNAALTNFREESSLLFLAAFAFLVAAGFIVARLAGPTRTWLAVLAAVGALGLVLAGGLNLEHDWLNVVRIQVKRQYPQADILFSRSSFIGRYDIVHRGPGHPTLKAYENGRTIDTIRDHPLEAYQIDPRIPHTLMKDPTILILGLSGDGVTKTARELGGKVYGVEINPAVVSLQTNELVPLNANSYQDIDVTILDARSYVEQSDLKYDMITLLNTHLARGHTTGRSPSPEYLFTVEAIHEYLDHLTDRGVVLVEEVVNNPQREPPVWKLLWTMRQVLLERGSTQPEQHFFVFQWRTASNNYIQIVMKKTPFTQEEIVKLNLWLEDVDNIREIERDLDRQVSPITAVTTVLHTPGEALPSNVSRLVRGEVEEDFLRARNLRVTTDDRPFHFDVDPARPEVKRVYARTFVATLILLAFFVPVLGRQRSKLLNSLPLVLVVVLTGLGFLLLARIHRWTGMDGVRTAEGGEGVTGAMIRARIWVAGRLGGGLQALLGAPMAAYSGCGERDGGIGHGKRRSRDCAGASLRGRWVGWWVSGGRAPSGWEWNGSQSG